MPKSSSTTYSSSCLKTTFKRFSNFLSSVSKRRCSKWTITRTMCFVILNSCLIMTKSQRSGPKMKLITPCITSEMPRMRWTRSSIDFAISQKVLKPITRSSANTNLWISKRSPLARKSRESWSLWKKSKDRKVSKDSITPLMTSS